MGKVKTILCSLLLFALCFCGIDAHAVNAAPNPSLRDVVVANYTKQIGVKELTGKNDGVMVEKYLASVGLKKGNPWCAAVVSYVFTISGVPNPKSGWAPSYFPPNKVICTAGNYTMTPRAGDVFGIYFNTHKRIAHVGFIDAWNDGRLFTTCEGNTSPDAVNGEADREGQGFYRKRRLKRQAFKIANWIDHAPHKV